VNQLPKNRWGDYEGEVDENLFRPWWNE
jgi:hypothetical protein